MYARKILFLVFSVFIGAVAFSVTPAMGQVPRILTGQQGGTGIGSATAGDVGKCLTVSGNSPFTYSFATCGTGGGGGGSGIGWTWNGQGQLRTSTTTDDVLLGRTSTSSPSKLEVFRSTLNNLYAAVFHGDTQVDGTLTVNSVTATSTTATSTFPQMYSSTSTISNLNGVYFIDGTRFSRNGAGIQEAINACYANGGGKIKIPTGKYIVSTAIGLKSNCWVSGEGTSTVLFLQNGANTNIFNTATVGLDSVHLSDMLLDGNSANQTGAGTDNALVAINGSDVLLRDIVIENLYVMNSYKHAIFLTGDNTVNRYKKIIRNNYVENHGSASVIGYGIYVDYARNTLIEGNTIKDSDGNDAIEMGNQGEITTIGNYVYDGQIQFPFAHNSKIIGNYVFTNAIQNDANRADNMVITDNHVLRTKPGDFFGGISVYGASSTIANNYVYVTRQSGIRVAGGSGHNIANNQVYGVDGASTTMTGIKLDSGSNGNIVHGNQIDGFGSGVYIVQDWNTVYGNKVSSSTNGVELVSSLVSGRTMQNNTIYGNNLSSTTNPYNKNNQSSITNFQYFDRGTPTSTMYGNFSVEQSTGGYGVSIDRNDIPTDGDISTSIWSTYGNKAFNTARMIFRKVAGGGGQFEIWTGNSTGVGLSPKFTLLRDGNVGIGNTNPSNTLNVQGDISGQNVNATSSTATSTFQGGFVAANGGGNIGFFTSAPTTKFVASLTSNSIASFHNGSAASGLWGINLGFLGQTSQGQITTAGSLPLVFLTGGTRDTMTAGTEWMRLTTTGNLGIGTTSPYAKLSVAGATVAESFTATSSATSTLPTFYSSTSTISNLNGVVYVDGRNFPKTDAGIQQAINFCYSLSPRCNTVDLLDTTTRVDTSIEVRGGIKVTSSASSTLSAFGTFAASNGIFFHQGTDATPDNVIIEKITFNLGGNATAFSNRGGDNIQFRDNFVSGTTTAAGAVLFDGTRGTSATSSRFLVLRNTFRNLTATSGASTIYFLQTSGKGSVYPSVLQNTFENTGGPGVKIDELAPLYNLTVSNNTFINQLSGNHYYDPAIMVWGGISNPGRIFNTVVANNVYRNSTNYSGYTFGGGGVWLYQSFNTSVTDNMFTGSWDPTGQDDYIFVAPGRVTNVSDGYLIANNTIEGVAAAWDPDSMKNVNVTGNTVRDSGHCFDVGYNIQINVHIHGNSCINSYHRRYNAGLVFYNATTLQNVVVENNKYIDTTGSTTLRGDILLTGGLDFSTAIVRNNYFYRAGSNPAFVAKELGGEKAPLDLSFNTVEGASSIDKNPSFSNGQIPFFSSTTTGSGTTTNKYLTGNNNFFWDWTNQRLGIGTSSPYAKLSVTGFSVLESFSATSTTATSSVVGAFAVGTTSAFDRIHLLTASGTGMTFDRSGTTDNESSEIKFKYGNNTFWAGFIRATKVSGGGGAISIGTGVSGGASASDALTITNGQRVGLGIASPENKLQVVGGIQTSSSASSPSGAATVLSQESGYGRIQSFGSTPLSLNPLGNNVGIATTSPSATLGIIGNLLVNNTATSTFMGSLNVQNRLQIGTSSIYLNGSGTSTFSHGISLASGCISVNGTCISPGSASAAGSNGQIQFNNGGALGASANMSFDQTAGGELRLEASAAVGAGNGGRLFLIGGAADTVGNGGQVRLDGADGGSVSGDGGGFLLVGGAAVNGNGGNVSLSPGNSVAGGVDGTVQITDPSTGNAVSLDTSTLTDNRSFIFPDMAGTFALTRQLVSTSTADTWTASQFFNASTTLGSLNTSSSTLGVFLAGNGTTTALAVRSLASCDTIDTDANGNLKCGTDASGGGGSVSSTSTYDWIVYKNGSTVTVYDTMNNTDVFTGTTLNAVWPSIVNAATSTANGRFAVFFKGGVFPVSGTSTINGGSIGDMNPRWIITGSGSSTIFQVNANTTVWQFSNEARAIMSNFNIAFHSSAPSGVGIWATTTRPTSARATMRESVVQNIEFFSTTSPNVGHAMRLDSVFRNYFTHLEMKYLAQGIWERNYYSNSQFISGDNHYLRSFCEVDSGTPGYCLNIDGVGGMVNQNVIDDFNGISNDVATFNDIMYRFSNTQSMMVTNFNAENFATVTQMLNGAIGNTVSSNKYIIPYGTASRYAALFENDATSYNNTFACSRIDTVAASNVWVIYDKNSVANYGYSMPNIIQGVDGGKCKITGSATEIYTRATSSTVIRGIVDDVNGTNNTWDNIEIDGNRVIFNLKQAVNAAYAYISFQTNRLAFFFNNIEEGYLNGSGLTVADTVTATRFVATSTAATSTFKGVTADCFSTDGVTCIGAAGGSYSGTGGAGQITYWTGATAFTGASDFIWDNTLKHLGIGTSTPWAGLSVVDADENTPAFVIASSTDYSSIGFLTRWTTRLGLFGGANKAGYETHIGGSTSTQRFALNGTTIFGRMNSDTLMVNIDPLTAPVSSAALTADSASLAPGAVFDEMTDASLGVTTMASTSDHFGVGNGCNDGGAWFYIRPNELLGAVANDGGWVRGSGVFNTRANTAATPPAIAGGTLTSTGTPVMEVTICTPHVMSSIAGSSTAIMPTLYGFGFGDTAIGTAFMSSTLTAPANGSFIAASTTDDWWLYSVNGNVGVRTNTGVSTSSTKTAPQTFRIAMTATATYAYRFDRDTGQWNSIGVHTTRQTQRDFTWFLGVQRPGATTGRIDFLFRNLRVWYSPTYRF